MLVVFYNVENLFDTHNDPRTRDDDFTPHGELEWDESRYQEKLDDLAYVLDAVGPENHQPGLIGFCEVENYRVVEDLIGNRRLQYMPYKIIHTESRDQRGIDNALVYSEDAFEYLGHEALNIDRFAPSPLFSRDILHVWGKLHDGSVLHVFVNHWPSRRDGQDETEYKRKAAAKSLKHRVDQLVAADRNAQILIMGDFNDTPVDYTVKTILQAGRQSKGSPELANLGWEIHDRKMGTVFRDGEWSLFDQFIVSHSLLKRVHGKKMHLFNDAEVMYTGRSGVARPSRTYVGARHAGGFSDHLAVWLQLD